MFKDTHAFSSFSVDDLAAAKKFYGETLGIDVKEDKMGLHLQIMGSNPVFVYQKDNHEPASYTTLNFPVSDVEKTVADLKAKGVQFEHYEGMTDEDGIARGSTNGWGGPDIAWFTDPAKNVIAIMQV